MPQHHPNPNPNPNPNPSPSPNPNAGIAPKVVRALASGAIQFSTYEATKEWSLNLLARRFPQL